jgi:hypothetical protein
MSLINKISDFVENTKENIEWHLKFSNPVTFIHSVFTGIMNLERGTEVPFYFPFLTRHIKRTIRQAIVSAGNFVRYHEPEINLEGKEPHPHYQRLEYFLQHFYLYQNETLRNLYYYKQAPKGHYERLNHQYNYIYASWLIYNAISGASLVAVTNYIFKRRLGAKFSTSLIATVPLSFVFVLNYHISDAVKSYFINNSVRRLGHGDIVVGKFERYPKNIEYTRF